MVLLAINVAGTLPKALSTTSRSACFEVVPVHALEEALDLGVRREAERVLAVLEQDLECLVGLELPLEVVVRAG